jgi:hypothetical protein
MSTIEKIKNQEVSISDLVKGQTATFQYYRSGNLYYKTTDGFEFPIPISDTGEASFNQEHTALELMRWIRKQYQVIKEGA